jgi:hypothetical protein
MATKNLFDNQIQNRNFLSPIGFKFVLNKAPKVAFFSNASNIPNLTLGTTAQPNYLRDIPVPGDKMEFEDFTLRFLVDENLENYMEIQNWIRGLGFPESLVEIYNLQNNTKGLNNKQNRMENIYSDGTLEVLNSNKNLNFKVVFKDMFPYQLSSLSFDATKEDVEYFTADVSFKYSMYNIVNKRGENL